MLSLDPGAGPDSPQDRRNLAVAVAVGLILRVVLILSYPPVLRQDSPGYLDLAHRLASWHLAGFNGARTPGYPFMLLLLGYSPTAAWCLQAAFGLLATAIIYWLVRRLGGSGTAALVAALLYTTSAVVLAVERQVMTETLATFLITAAGAICAGLVSSDARRRGLAALLGATLFCLCLVRPDTLVVAVCLVISVLAVWHFQEGRGSALRTLVRPAAAMMLPALIGLFAWAMVNRETIGVTSVSTVLGHNLIDHIAPSVTVQPGADHDITAAYVDWRARVEARSGGDYANTSWEAEPALERAAHLDAAHLSGRLQSIALSAIASHPVQYVGSSVKQWPRFWLPPNYPDEFHGGAGSAVIHGVWNLQRVIQVLIAALFLALCLAEIISRLRRSGSVLGTPGALLALAVLVGSLPPVFLAYGETGRYGYVYFPLVLAVAFAAGDRVLQAAWTRRSTV
jgi:hypothetical protein